MNYYKIICEGKSEFAYIQLLRRFFLEENLQIFLDPINAGSGRPDIINKTYKTLLSKEKICCQIFIDEDIYYRGSCNVSSLKCHNILFNHWCFEDFLIMHYDTSLLINWITECTLTGHLNTPLHESHFLPSFKKIFGSEYKKGEIPSSFSISYSSLKNLFMHSNDTTIPFYSKFATFLQNFNGLNVILDL